MKLIGNTVFGRALDTLEASVVPVRPMLHVVGDRKHFAKSVLGRLSAQYFDVTFLDDGEFQQPLVPSAWIKWSPWSIYDIPDSVRGRIPSYARVINDTHFFCDKRNVQACFAHVARRPLSVDALSHHGMAVRKARVNAKHDGVVVELPLTDRVSDEFVYERLINNVIGEYACDIRVPIVLGSIPFVYVKIRPVEDRFSNTNAFAKIMSPFDVLSLDELRLCQRFADVIGLDYGELDVLRDMDSRQVYIVDANNTPYGPPNHLSAEERDVALRLMGATVIKQFFTM